MARSLISVAETSVKKGFNSMLEITLHVYKLNSTNRNGDNDARDDMMSGTNLSYSILQE